MEKTKLDRINELAQKSRTEAGLTESEKVEQETLRREYIEAYKASLRSQLENIILVDKDGTQHPVQKKADPNITH